ncbi:MAG TPA: DUF2073 domain-containing protein [Candidatus Nanoarchaeia archaeon]|nr:DUF2073 domain-containing protein [Candidatus Nanoarchaeia archaeon]
MNTKRDKKLHGLSLHVMPFSEVKGMSISERVRKILSLIMGNKIIILHGRLRPEEEARLIEDTMVMVDHVKNFKGIELAVIEPDMRKENFMVKMKHELARRLIGDSATITVVGPASVIKEIKKDPKKLELLLD